MRQVIRQIMRPGGVAIGMAAGVVAAQPGPPPPAPETALEAARVEEQLTPRDIRVTLEPPAGSGAPVGDALRSPLFRRLDRPMIGSIAGGPALVLPTGVWLTLRGVTGGEGNEEAPALRVDLRALGPVELRADGRADWRSDGGLSVAGGGDPAGEESEVAAAELVGPPSPWASESERVWRVASLLGEAAAGSSVVTSAAAAE